MKVLHVIPAYEPAWAFGGTVTASVHLCRELAKKGLDITVYTTNANGTGGYLEVPLNARTDLNGVNVWYFYCNLGRGRAFYSRGLSKKLGETVLGFDLVHVSAIWQWHQFTVSRICTKAQKPYIVTPHNSLSSLSIKLAGNIKKEIYWRLLSQSTIKKASALNFLCEGERRSSLANTFSVPSFIVPNGIDLDGFSYFGGSHLKRRGELGLSDDEIILLFLGRIHPTKRLDRVIESVGKIQTRKKFRLLLVGPIVDDNYYQILIALIEKYSLRASVRFIGPIGNDDVLKFYSVADLLILISEFEGVSMTSIEALASGVPLLISKGVANWEEILRAEAGIVTDGDPNDIAQKLEKIDKGEIDLDNFSSNARKLAEQRYDINEVASLMIKAYEDVLAGRRSSELQWK
jgi:glycosyltransferase involved in cell wall biosynthesis